MRHLFIVNPVAGGKHNKSEETIGVIRAAAESQSEPYEIYRTKAPLDAIDKIRQEASSTEALRVYACGGDGTFNECINGAAGLSHVSVTHFPCGTGNDFVKMFGKDNIPLFQNISALMTGKTRPLDLIEIRTPERVRYGVNICSVGIDARIGTDVHKYSAIPIIGGATGYVVSMAVNLFRGVNQELTITTQDNKLTGSFAMLCACNGRFYGGGFNPVPEAMPDDGILEFLIVKAVSRFKFLRVVGKYAKGRFREASDIITHIRGKTMSVDSQIPLAVNIDGELIRAQNITFSVIPGHINFTFPESMVFLWSDDISGVVSSIKHEI